MLAEWLASPENPYFATNLANRVWAHFFGRASSSGRRRPHQQPGVATRSCSTSWASSSPSTSTTSRSWSATSAPRGPTSARRSANETQRRPTTRNFAHADLRRIRAEMLLDCISQVTETKDKFPGLPLGARAVQIADGGSQHLLPDHVRPGDPRDGLLVRGARLEPTLSQALHLLNGDTVNAKIQQGGLVAKLMADEEVPRGARSRSSTSAASPQADQGRARQAPAHPRRGVQPGAGPGRHLLGPAEQPRVPVQSLSRTRRPADRRSIPAGAGRSARVLQRLVRSRTCTRRSPASDSPACSYSRSAPSASRRRRRQGDGEGHLPGPRLADLPEPVQLVPQRRQEEGRA